MAFVLWLGGSVGWSNVPLQQKVAGLIPDQDTYLVCRFDPWSERVWEATDFLSHVSVCLSVCLSMNIPLRENNNDIYIYRHSCNVC